MTGNHQCPALLSLDLKCYVLFICSFVVLLSSGYHLEYLTSKNPSTGYMTETLEGDEIKLTSLCASTLCPNKLTKIYLIFYDLYESTIILLIPFIIKLFSYSNRTSYFDERL